MPPLTVTEFSIAIPDVKEYPPNTDHFTVPSEIFTVFFSTFPASAKPPYKSPDTFLMPIQMVFTLTISPPDISTLFPVTAPLEARPPKAALALPLVMFSVLPISRWPGVLVPPSP